MSKATKSSSCTFHHVLSDDAISLISSSIGIHVKAQKNNAQVSYPCSLEQADEIRSKLASFLRPYPGIWFSADASTRAKMRVALFNPDMGQNIRVSFGSVLSTSRFLLHDVPLDGMLQWTMACPNQNTLQIKCQGAANTSIRFTLSLERMNKNVLVIDGDSHTSIILNLTNLIREVQKTDTHGSVEVYGNHALMESLVRCSEILIQISPKASADQFLDFLQDKHRCQIYYTIMSIEHGACKAWDKVEFNWYPAGDAVYAIAMLHSLGYLFDDKYHMHAQLQSTMVQLAEEDGEQFYQLAVQAVDELQKCHWLDLTTVFDGKEPNRRKTAGKSKLSRVGVVHVTPTRLSVLPKEVTTGHRAMRHAAFQGAENFCLVYLKPDPPNTYLSEDVDHFRKVFGDGIELGRDRFHLFGASNSQVKEHVFWFIRASTMAEIQQKRLQLGRLENIDNRGTYVARLGLWFTKSSPTGIQLIYCSTKAELDRRVQRGETCVMEIDDIMRNEFCFTDGNGFISKGLAKRIAGKAVTVPTAFQIRMAGCKGLLVIDPQSTLDQFYVKIRPSMKKFDCDDWSLEICESSEATPTRLNNQIILLLSDLGVPNETFLRLQQQWFNKAPANSIGPDYLYKNKIPLPANECRYMFGCAFETSLEPGTCFIRYEVLDEKGKSFPQRQYRCVEGPVIVTKNPCPYAGDLLLLRAVDVPELHDLHDVIVFTTKGARPDFHKIAGSDLDGDKYFVYWGTEFRLQCSVPPLDYAAEKKIKHPTPISPEDVIDYYLSTLGATSYGEVFNLHAVVVDKNTEQHPQRTCQTLAIELARMFASAIDSGKTGYVIDKRRVQAIREQYGQSYPDFLMKYGRNYYLSQSIVGILYRNAVMYKRGNADELSQVFAQINIGDSQLHASPTTPLSSLPVKTMTSASVKPKKEKGSKKSTDKPKSAKK